MKIYLATDHAGFELKEQIKAFLVEQGYDVEDFGAHQFDEKDDYPDFIQLAAQAISDNTEDRAIILGSSGQGEAIVANKFAHVRAVVYYGKEEQIPLLARQHNNANVLSLGARFVSPDEAKRAVKTFLDTPFTNEERHVRRIEKINKIESR